MTASDDSPLTFPCRFPVKAMGRADGAFERTVWSIIVRHAPDISEDDVSITESRQGSYVSVTVTVTAPSRAQLDAIYADLQAHDAVLAAL